MTVIKVPKTPRSAFNPNRPASALLQAHIEHLEHALGVAPTRPKRPRTEGEAAQYIGELTSRLMQPGVPAPSPAAPLEKTRASKPKPKRKVKPKPKPKRSKANRRA